MTGKSSPPGKPPKSSPPSSKGAKKADQPAKPEIVFKKVESDGSLDSEEAAKVHHLDPQPPAAETKVVRVDPTQLASTSAFVSAADYTDHSALTNITMTEATRLRRAESMAYKRRKSGGMDEETSNVLYTVPHIASLPQHVIRQFHVAKREYFAGETVLASGQEVEHLHVLLKGTIEVFNSSIVSGGKRVGTIKPPNVFGMDSLLLEYPNKFILRAGFDQTLVGIIPRNQFLTALRENIAFSQSIGRRITDSMDVFTVFKNFAKKIFARNNTDRCYLDMNGILNAYRQMNNVIHPLINSDKVDVNAWLYALRRLPDNVTDTFVFDLTRSLPPFLSEELRTHAFEQPVSAVSASNVLAQNLFDVCFIPTAARRRCCWNIGMQGKSLIMLRDGFTDLIDFLSCLCIHCIESHKLRQRLQTMVNPPVMELLRHHLNQAANVDAPGALAKMPLSDFEREGLMKIWPDDVLNRIYHIIVHREELFVRVDSSLSRRFDFDTNYQWGLQIQSKMREILALDDLSPFPEDVVIDVMSSNTHSAKNCLSGYVRRKREDILEWGKRKKPNVVNLEWANQEDLLYSLLPGYLAEDTTRQEEYDFCLRASGISIVGDTALTGLQVDIVDVSKLKSSDLDSGLADTVAATPKVAKLKHRYFILNMDFSFGAQADGITHALSLIFGHRIRSFNIVGKAGGLQGKRGDILLASHVIYSKSASVHEDSTDEFRPCGNIDIEPEQFKTQTSNVHVGPVLTIPGTILQNVTLLRFYRALWGCIGVEMEGTYFQRQIEESVTLGTLRNNLVTRYAYYTSDLPLQASGETNLSTSLPPNEGVPCVYTIIRVILNKLLRPLRTGCESESDAEGSKRNDTPPPFGLENVNFDRESSERGRESAEATLTPIKCFDKKHREDQPANANSPKLKAADNTSS